MLSLQAVWMSCLSCEPFEQFKNCYFTLEKNFWNMRSHYLNIFRHQFLQKIQPILCFKSYISFLFPFLTKQADLTKGDLEYQWGTFEIPKFNCLKTELDYHNSKFPKLSGMLILIAILAWSVVENCLPAK